MNDKIEESKITNNHTEVGTKSIDGQFEIDDGFDLGDELHDFDYGDEELTKTKEKGENIIRKPNIIRDNEAEIRAAAQSAFEKYGPVTVVIVNDKSHSVVIEKKEPSLATKPELKPCVKPFFCTFALMLIAALIISWMY